MSYDKSGYQSGRNMWDNEAAFFAGLGDPAPVSPAEVPWYETLIKTAAPVLMTAYQQNQMTKLNIARINQGMAPLSAEQYSQVYQPAAARVQVGPDANAQRFMLYAGIGLLAFLGLRRAKVL